MASLQRVLLLVSCLLSLSSFSSAQAVTNTPLIATATSPPSSTNTQLPTCANSCLQGATGTQSCATGDQACLCSYSTQVQESIWNCLQKSHACSDQEVHAAFEYYPAFCKNLNLATETNLPTMIATAGGGSPTKSSITDASLPTGATETGVNSTDSSKNLHAGLQLPAILGITLVVVIMIIGITAMMVWSYVKRRQAIRRPRMDLGGEFVEPKPRPPRNRDVKSDFLVQPSSVQKDSFGGGLSRSSTLVPPPPVAKDEKRSSDEKRNSARSKALKLLLGNEGGLRSSLLSSKSGSKKSSLIVPPLDIRKSQQDRLRMSKF